MTPLCEKLIDWLWEYMDFEPELFDAAGYDRIKTEEQAIAAVKQLMNEDEFEALLVELP